MAAECQFPTDSGYNWRRMTDEIEAVLGPRRDVLGADYTPYFNHVCRVAHFCRALHPGDGDVLRRIVIAACFHDLGIWPSLTLDYLPPSVALARDYLNANDRADWVEEVGLMIDEHHRMTPARASRFPLVEAFRKADLIDVTLGMVRFGLPAGEVAEVRRRFPNAGFHLRLVRLGVGWIPWHPLRPLPFLRW